MTSRFHLIVTVGLAMCLGIVGTLALSARNAIGYPAGAAVSVGTNPVVSAGGTIKWGEAAAFLTRLTRVWKAFAGPLMANAR